MPLASRQVNIGAATAGSIAFRLATSEAMTKQPDSTGRVKQFDIREAFKAGTRRSIGKMHTIATVKIRQKKPSKGLTNWPGIASGFVKRAEVQHAALASAESPDSGITPQTASQFAFEDF